MISYHQSLSHYLLMILTSYLLTPGVIGAYEVPVHHVSNGEEAKLLLPKLFNQDTRNQESSGTGVQEDKKETTIIDSKDDILNKKLRNEKWKPLANECTMDSIDDCGLNTFPEDVSYIVYPGGDTRCIFSYSTPFGFQVLRGDPDKLLYYYQGGGACWNYESTFPMPFCSTDIEPYDLAGVFNRTNPMNKFKDYTIVIPLYCSGDVFGGNVTRDYKDKAIGGKYVVQVGVKNARAVLDWTLYQQQTGALASKLTDLVIMGCSAGAVGLQLWGPEMLNSLSYERASLVPDSYVGIFPNGTEEKLMYDFGFCSSGLFPTAELEEDCWNQELIFKELVSTNIAQFPEIPYAFIQSKTDVVQETFYMAVGATEGADDRITPAEFYLAVNDVFTYYHENNENFVAYLIDGNQHCYTNVRIYFSTDPQSQVGFGENTTNPMMYEWASDFPINEGGPVSSVCDGDLVDPTNPEEGRRRLAFNNQTYCDERYLPYTFNEVVPTVKPTVRPTVQATKFPTFSSNAPVIVSFDTTVIMDGVIASDFDEPAKSAFITINAEALQVSTSDLTIVSIVDVNSGRKLLKTYPTAIAAQVLFDISTLYDVTKYSSIDDMVNDMQSTLEVSYADPATASSWVTLSVEYGSTTITSDTVVVMSEPVYGETEISQVTSNSPNSSPTKDVVSSDGFIAGIVVGVVVLSLIVFGYIYYINKSKSASSNQRTVDERSTVSKPGVELRKSIVENETTSAIHTKNQY